MSGVGPHACALARGRGLTHPLRSHVGPYAGRKLVEKVARKATMSQERAINSFPFLALRTSLDPPHFSSISRNISDGKNCPIGSPKDHDPHDSSHVSDPRRPSQ